MSDASIREDFISVRETFILVQCVINGVSVDRNAI